MAIWIAGSCWRLPSARADEAAAATDSAADADALIQKGIELRKAGQDRQALAEFERAFSLYGSVRALAQMALAEQALGLWREAHEHLQQALPRMDDPWIAEHRSTLEAAAHEIASQLGSLEISCNVAGAEVRLNGVVLGLTPLSSPVPLVAGANVIVVSKPGFFEIARQVNIDAGRLSRLNVVLTSSPEPSLAPARAAEPLPSRVLAAPQPSAAAALEAGAGASPARDIFFYTALGLSALGLSAGATGYVMREVNVQQYNDDQRCSRLEGIRRSEECPEQAAAYQRGEVLVIAGFTGAAVFGLTAAYLWLSRPAKAAATLSFGCAPALAVFACAGEF